MDIVEEIKNLGKPKKIEQVEIDPQDIFQYEENLEYGEDGEDKEEGENKESYESDCKRKLSQEIIFAKKDLREKDFKNFLAQNKKPKKGLFFEKNKLYILTPFL